MLKNVIDELEQTKERLAAASKPILDVATHTAAAAGDYVRASPWAGLGIALLAGVLLGLLAGKR
jgi:ElaB/YqjD/DUF883 family membrane-anchored ribosome-binding protein